MKPIHSLGKRGYLECLFLNRATYVRTLPNENPLLNVKSLALFLTYLVSRSCLYRHGTFSGNEKNRSPSSAISDELLKVFHIYGNPYRRFIIRSRLLTRIPSIIFVQNVISKLLTMQMYANFIYNIFVT